MDCKRVLLGTSFKGCKPLKNPLCSRFVEILLNIIYSLVNTIKVFLCSNDRKETHVADAAYVKAHADLSLRHQLR